MIIIWTKYYAMTCENTFFNIYALHLSPCKETYDGGYPGIWVKGHEIKGFMLFLRDHK